jgi:DHA2 family multidrug resistance protein-like MFS transporter
MSVSIGPAYPPLLARRYYFSMTNTGAAAPDPRRWLVLGITASGLLLICVDITVLYVALPSLTSALAATNSEKLWILNAYPVVVAGLLPGFGTLGDRYGHRRLFSIGLIVFGAASLSAAYASGATTLIVARAALGLGAAMMMPATLAIIRTTFIEPRERSIALGIWAGVASAGMAAGPLVAGLLLTRFTWGSVFLINVPVVAVAFIATLYCVPRRAAPGGPPWDATGSLQLLVALAALMYAIKEPARQDWSALRLMFALAIAAGSIALYLRGQRRRAQPLLDFTLFRIPDFGGAFAAACLGTAGAVGLELVMSQYLQLVELRTPLAAALVLLPLAITGLVAAPLAGRLLHQRPPASVARGGFMLAALCVLTLALLPAATPLFTWWRLLLLAGVGVGMSATVTFASSIIMNAAPAERGGMAASIEEVGFELGGALGVAVFGSIMTIAYAATLQLPPDAGALPASVRDSFDEALRIAGSLPAAQGAALQAAGAQSFASALRAVLIGVALLWFITGLAIGSGRSKTAIAPAGFSG